MENNEAEKSKKILNWFMRERERVIGVGGLLGIFIFVFIMLVKK